MGRGLLVMGYRARFASQLDHQLLCLNLDAGDPGSYETAIINRWGRFEVLPNRFDDQRLNSSCWHSMDRSGALGRALEDGRREIVPVPKVPFAGVAWGHAVPAAVVDAAGQERLRFHPFGLVVGDLLVEPRLDAIEQSLIPE